MYVSHKDPRKKSSMDQYLSLFICNPLEICAQFVLPPHPQRITVYPADFGNSFRAICDSSGGRGGEIYTIIFEGY